MTSTSIGINFAPALAAATAPKPAATGLMTSRRRLTRALPGRVLTARLVLFAAGIACGIAVTAGLRTGVPGVVQAVTTQTAAAGDLDLSDPVYDLKKMPQPVWHISAPLEVEIERAKHDLEAALVEGTEVTRPAK